MRTARCTSCVTRTTSRWDSSESRMPEQCSRLSVGAPWPSAGDERVGSGDFVCFRGSITRLVISPSYASPRVSPHKAQGLGFPGRAPPGVGLDSSCQLPLLLHLLPHAGLHRRFPSPSTTTTTTTTGVRPEMQRKPRTAGDCQADGVNGCRGNGGEQFLTRPFRADATSRNRCRQPRLSSRDAHHRPIAGGPIDGHGIDGNPRWRQLVHRQRRRASRTTRDRAAHDAASTIGICPKDVRRIDRDTPGVAARRQDRSSRAASGNQTGHDGATHARGPVGVSLRYRNRDEASRRVRKKPW